MKKFAPLLSMSVAIEMQSSGSVFGSHWHLRKSDRILEVDQLQDRESFGLPARMERFMYLPEDFRGRGRTKYCERSEVVTRQQVVLTFHLR
jgi:hypothetical protein